MRLGCRSKSLSVFVTERKGKLPGFIKIIRQTILFGCRRTCFLKQHGQTNNRLSFVPGFTAFFRFVGDQIGDEQSLFIFIVCITSLKWHPFEFLIRVHQHLVNLFWKFPTIEIDLFAKEVVILREEVLWNHWTIDLWFEIHSSEVKLNRIENY